MSSSPFSRRLGVLLTLVLAARSARAQCLQAPTFAGPVSYAAAPGYSATGIAHGDLDHDGDLDLVVCAGAQIVVLRNGGSGVFSLEAPVPSPATLDRLLLGREPIRHRGRRIPPLELGTDRHVGVAYLGWKRMPPSTRMTCMFM